MPAATNPYLTPLIFSFDNFNELKGNSSANSEISSILSNNLTRKTRECDGKQTHLERSQSKP